MGIRELRKRKLQKLYKLEYKKVDGEVINYGDTIVHKFDITTQKYIKFEPPRADVEVCAASGKILPGYFWHIDNLYIYDNDERDIIDITYCNMAYSFRVPTCLNIHTPTDATSLKVQKRLYSN